MKVEAEGEAAAIKLQAKAQAGANNLLSRSLTPELIRYQQMQKWDGKLRVFSGKGVIPTIQSADILGGNGQGHSASVKAGGL